MRRAPATEDTIIFQLAMPVQMSMTAPMSIAMTEVSPTDPGTVPAKRFQKLYPASVSPSRPPVARGVAPVMASSPHLCAIHTSDPDILLGYEKNRNARARRAGLRKFIPEPPNTSFPNTTAKATARARVHSGVSTGTIRGMSIPETRYPSLTSSLRICAKVNSIPRPTMYDTR